MKYSPTKKIVIAIDGFSSCGKSTFAKEIAARIGYVFIDTGAMYRAVTLYGLRHGAVQDGDVNEALLIAMLPEIEITFAFNSERGASDIFLNGENVEKRIRSIEVSDLVSKVSGIAEVGNTASATSVYPAVRAHLLELQRSLAASQNVIMDGRDIGTVVFPDAELKIFMTADPAIRAQRRYKELEVKGEKVSLEEVERNLRERDHADQTRAVSPLRQAEDAVVLDNSHMTLPEQMDWVMRRIEKITCAPCTSK